MKINAKVKATRSPSLKAPSRPRCKCQPKHKSWQDDSDGSRGDWEEDQIMVIKLQRLQELNGDADPLWVNEPEFAGFTRATRAYALRSRSEQVEQKRNTN